VLVAGKACLILALATSLYGIGASLYGARTRRREWIASGRRAVYALAGTVVTAFVILELAFLRSDFSFQLVFSHSSTTTPTFYRLAAAWSSQEGSLLLWLLLLSLWSSGVLYLTRHRLREVAPYATAVLLGFGAFFAGLLVFLETPFAFTPGPVPIEGVGLNPLLRHPSMMIHPPMLYSGYVAFTIPFAFAIGALAARRLDAEWIRATRRFALIAWAFLGLGLLLGARWSYTELGWGGYWAWDPVENAALMPWLAGTAFLHSIMVQEKRGMLKVWNVSLIVGTFSLALLGTFLVRSGVLQSIHAFGDNTVGPYLLGLIAVVLLGSAALIVSRVDELRSPKRIDSLISREAVFLVNNLLLVALCLAIFWGTFFPLISELFTGQKSSLAAPWFDRYTTPLAIALVLFTGIGPLLAWRRVSWASAKRLFRVPLAAAAAAAVVLAAATDAASRPWALALFALAAFALAGLGQELWQAGTARRRLGGGSIPGSMWAVASRNRRRYGGYLVHAGVAVLLIGIAASSSFQTNREIELKPGESATIDGYRVHYVRPTSHLDGLAFTAGAVLRVEKGGEAFTLRPTRNFYRPTGAISTGRISDYLGGEADSNVGLKAGLARDFWTAAQPDITGIQRRGRLADRAFSKCVKGGPGTPSQCKAWGAIMRAAAVDPKLRPAAFEQIERVQQATAKRIAAGYVSEDAATTFKVIVNPLVAWIWIGGVIALVGAAIAIWPARPRRRGALVRTEADALKEAKYREIRDAELDHAAGKISDEDFAAVDAELRAEAVKLLDRLEPSRQNGHGGNGHRPDRADAADDSSAAEAPSDERAPVP
jgi:cytochrome c-type biogenesis protein CcmF